MFKINGYLKNKCNFKKQIKILKINKNIKN